MFPNDLCNEPVVTLWNGVDLPWVEAPRTAVCRQLYCLTVLCRVFPCIIQCLLMEEWLVTFCVWISDKQQHWNDTSKHNPFTVLMNCLLFEAVTHGLVICTFAYMNTNACDKKKLMLKICLSFLQLLIMNISFVSMTCISHWQICFSKGFFSRC